MAAEVFDDDLGPELRPTKVKEKTIDYQALTYFIKNNFPISKTDYILKVIENLKNSAEHQTQFSLYAGKLSNDDLNRLFDGIKASTIYK